MNTTLVSKKALPVLKKYGVQKASLFGSMARNEGDNLSDIDLLIEPPNGMGLSFISLKHELEDALQKKIDLISYKSLNKHLKPYVLKDEVRIL